jgi:hypothetical protein
MDVDNIGHTATDLYSRTHDDPEGVKPLVSDPASQKKRGKTHPRSLTKQTVVNATPVNDLRRVSASLSPCELRYPDPNYFVPSFAVLFHILATMNDKVCTLRPFGENGTVNNWIPQVSNIVFAVLAFVQVLRAQQVVQALLPSQARFLESFTSKHPLETIVIPGPLVPFFRSISVSNPGFGNFGNVVPVIPPFSLAENRLYNIDYTPPNAANRFEGITMMLPNIPLMMDQLVRTVKHVLTVESNANKKYSTFNQLLNCFGITEPVRTADLHLEFLQLRKSIGFWHRPTASDGLVFRFANYIANACPYFPDIPQFDINHAEVPANPAANPPTDAVPATWTTITELIQFMCMDTSSDWFSKFLEGMHNFNKQWKENVLLSDIHPTQSTAGLITFRDAEVTAIPTRTMFRDTSLNNASHQLTLNTYATTSCPYILPDDAIDAQTAQLNLHCSSPFAHNMRIGASDVTHFGDYWSAIPQTFVTDRADITSEFPNVISSPAYFADA